MIDDPNSETWLTLLVSRQLGQRLAKMATAQQQSVDELAARLLDAAISNWENLPQTSWRVPLLDAGDGSGDALLPIPNELLASAGWVEGDTLSFEDQGNGTLLLKNAGNEDAELLKIAKNRLDDGEAHVDVKIDDL
ncbi:hypothetical protein [Chromobacterium amazonense]|uniref:hypothetical protein n=1 Tax=Chromobacterium amazonense TaxID=1382803 RepID=UPI003F7AD6BE